MMANLLECILLIVTCCTNILLTRARPQCSTDYAATLLAYSAGNPTVQFTTSVVEVTSQTLGSSNSVQVILEYPQELCSALDDRNIHTNYLIKLKGLETTPCNDFDQFINNIGNQLGSGFFREKYFKDNVSITAVEVDSADCKDWIDNEHLLPRGFTLDYTPIPLERQVKELTVNEGSDVTIDCDILSNLPLTALLWTRNSQALHTFLEKYTHGSIAQPSLHIGKLSVDDSGTYQCRGENSVGKGPISEPFILNVQKIPEKHIVRCRGPEHSHVMVAEGRTVDLLCEIETNLSRVEFSWLSDSHRSLPQAFSTDLVSSLKIPNAGEIDEGIYECQIFHASLEEAVHCYIELEVVPATPDFTSPADKTGCKDFPDIPHSFREIRSGRQLPSGRWTVFSELHYDCHAGFSLARGDNGVRLCIPKNSWNRRTPDCIPIQ